MFAMKRETIRHACSFCNIIRARNEIDFPWERKREREGGERERERVYYNIGSTFGEYRMAISVLKIALAFGQCYADSVFLRKPTLILYFFRVS